MSATQAFILTTGRCGSTLLSAILALHPNIVSLSEFFTVLGGRRAFEYGLLSGSDFCEQVLLRDPPEVAELLRLERMREVLSSEDRGRDDSKSPLLLIPLPALVDDPGPLLNELVGFARGLPLAPVGDHYAAVFVWLSDKLRRRIWVERSGGSIEYADCILRQWPGARIIHLWRNGIDCARSMSRHPYFRLLVARAHFRNRTLPVRESLDREIPLDRFGAYWSAMSIAGSKRLEALPLEQVLHVGYGDLATNPEQEIRRIFAFLGAAADDGIVQRAIPLVRPAQRRTEQPAAAEQESALQRACLPGRRALERLLRRASSAAIGAQR